jgi:integrase
VARKPTPLHRLHLRERRGKAVCWYRNRDWPFGPWDAKANAPSPAAVDAFRIQLARWAIDPEAGAAADDGLTVGTVLADWLESDDSPLPGRALELAREAVLWVCRLHPSTPAAEFGAAELEAWQDWMCDQVGAKSKRKFKKSTILSYRAAIVRGWWWATRHRGIPEHRPVAMERVPPPKRAVPNSRRRPVDLRHVAASLKKLQPGPAAAVRLLYHTGARVEELLGLRAADVVRTGRIETPSGARLNLDESGVWAAVLVEHKTDGVNDRVILFGPRARRTLERILVKKQAGDFLFDPRDAVAAQTAGQRARRQSRYGSRKPVKGESRKRKPRPFYTPGALQLAVKRAAELAGVPHWYPRLLRTTCGHVILRQGFGKDAARAYLGHADHDVTTRYTGKDLVTAAAVARRIG